MFYTTCRSNGQQTDSINHVSLSVKGATMNISFRNHSHRTIWIVKGYSSHRYISGKITTFCLTWWL